MSGELAGRTFCILRGQDSTIRITERIAAENGRDGVRSFAIEPGTVITDMAEETIASPDAQRWVPQMVERLTQLKKTQDRAAGLARCSEMCLRLASGKYDELSGRCLTPEDDFEELLQHNSDRPLILGGNRWSRLSTKPGEKSKLCHRQIMDGEHS